MKVALTLVLFSGLACALPNKKEVPFNEDDLAQALLHKRDMMDPNTMKTFIRKTLENPAVKKMANPKSIEAFLNQEVSVGDASKGAGVVQEIFEIVWNSEIVKELVKPETFQIVINSKAAKSVFNKEFVLGVLNHPSVKSLLSPETIHKVLNSDTIVQFLEPQMLKEVLDNPTVLGVVDALRNFDPKGAMAHLNLHQTKVYKALARYEFIHVFLYSQFAQKLFNWGWIHSIGDNQMIADIVTPANVKDAFNSPLLVQLLDPVQHEKLYELRTAKVFLSPAVLHEIFYSDSITKFATADHFEKVFKSPAFVEGITDASVADLFNSPALKSSVGEAAFTKYAGTPPIKALFHNGEAKAALNAAHKVFGAL